MNKQKLIDIFEANQGFSLPRIKKSEILDDSILNNRSDTWTGKADIEVLNCTTIAAVNKLFDEGYKSICALNMASDICPGGGVKKGSQAQEEYLCRVTDLYRHISANLQNKFNMKLYPFCPRNDNALNNRKAAQEFSRLSPEAQNYDGKDVAIYSHDVTILRDDEYKLIDERRRSTIGVISIAGIRNPKLVNGKLNENDEQTVRMKILQMLTIANIAEHDALVLGALGCGAFHNPPQQIAQIFKEILDDYKHFTVKKIVFAILANEGDPNYDAFARELRSPIAP